MLVSAVLCHKVGFFINGFIVIIKWHKYFFLEEWHYTFVCSKRNLGLSKQHVMCSIYSLCHMFLFLQPIQRHPLRPSNTSTCFCVQALVQATCFSFCRFALSFQLTVSRMWQLFALDSKIHLHLIPTTSDSILCTLHQKTQKNFFGFVVAGRHMAIQHGSARHCHANQRLL